MQIGLAHWLNHHDYLTKRIRGKMENRITKESILQKYKRQIEPFVNDNGETDFYIQEMSANQSALFQELNAHMGDKKVDLKSIPVLAATIICDENGKSIFTTDDAKYLAEQFPLRTLKDIVMRAVKMSKIEEKDAKDADSEKKELTETSS